MASVTDQPVMVWRVDLATGDVKFDGAIHIKCDETYGRKVTGTGDVMIGGAVLDQRAAKHETEMQKPRAWPRTHTLPSIT